MDSNKMCGQKTVMIIDDEANMRNTLKRLIEEFFDHVNVIECDQSDRAVALLMRNTPDLVLLDLIMPGKNGLQILKDIKETDSVSLKKIPIIMMTGIGNRELNNRARKMGAVDYITKPFNENVFLVKIRKYIGPLKSMRQ